MPRFQDVVTNQAGTALPGAFVTVRNSPSGTLASITADNGTALPNPLTADGTGAYYFNAPVGIYSLEFRLSLTEAARKIRVIDLATDTTALAVGLFVNSAQFDIPLGVVLVQTSGYSAVDKGSAVYVFDAAVNSAYVAANPLSSFLYSDGRGFRLSTEQDITPGMLGAVGDGTTDDSAAFVAAIAALKAAAISGYGYSNLGGPKLFIPSNVYYLGSTTLDLTHGIIIEGESTGFTGSGTSVLKWATGTTGIRFEQANTSGTTTVTARAYSSHPIIRNLTLYSTYSGTESEAHAIDMRCDGAVEDVGIFNFAGDGIHIIATAGSGGGTEGNSNGWFLKRVCIQGCRNGVHIDGADVNAGMAMALNLVSNRRWGVWDSSFLGNTHIGHQAAGNGAVAGSHPPSWVSQGGNRYVAIAGQEAGASTNAPSGTTADNTWWYYYSAGAADSTINCPAWLSGTTYRSGGSYLTDDTGNAGNVFTSCYHEGSQPFAQFVFPTLVLGGSIGINGKGVAILSGGSDINSSAGFAGPGGLSMLGPSHSFGKPSGATADTVFQCNSTNTFQISFNRYNSVGALLANDGLLIAQTGGIAYHVTSFHQFYTTGGRMLYFDANGLNLDSGKVITVNALQVVGARDTGWAADTGTAKKTANSTYAAGTTLTFSATYAQAEQTAMATRMAAVEAALQNIAQSQKAIKDALTAHGLIGT